MTFLAVALTFKLIFLIYQVFSAPLTRPLGGVAREWDLHARHHGPNVSHSLGMVSLSNNQYQLQFTGASFLL